MLKNFLLSIFLVTNFSLFAQIGFERHLNNYGSRVNFSIMRTGINADMDSDGDQDVILELEAEKKIVWFENTDGIGTFNRQQNVITNEGSYLKVQPADLDGDGDLDIILRSTKDHNLSWLENTSDNSWSKRHLVASSLDVRGATFALVRDIDSDGDLDLITNSNSAIKIDVYENSDGKGNFVGISNNLFDNEEVNSMETLDMDNDNDLDIVAVYSSSNRIVWYENDGKNNYSVAKIISIDINEPFGIDIEDIDGDNDLDLIVGSKTNNSNKIFWLENSGGNNFDTKHLIVEINGFKTTFDAEDLNGNGLIDFIYSSELNSKMIWLQNLGNGSFSYDNFVTTDLKEPAGFKCADFNSDGRLDVLAISDLEGRIAWYDLNYPFYNNNNPIYSDVIGSSTACNADFDNDGDIDIISMSFADNKLFWYENLDGQGDEMKTHIIGDVNGISSVSAIDINGNGYKDLLYTSMLDNKVFFDNNVGSGFFNYGHEIDSNLEGASDAKGYDFDGDGDTDIVAVGYYSNKIFWYENNGNEFFNRHELTDDFVGGTSIYIEDLNNDNRADIIIASSILNSIVWFENSNTTNQFEPAKLITDKVFDVTSLYVDDLDSDGYKDVVFGSLGEISLGWIKNNGINGTFSSINEIAKKTYVRSVSVADIDSDNDKDVVTSSLRFGSVNWYENTDGQGNFSNSIFLGSAIETTSIAPIDIDADSDIDLVSGTLNSNSVLWFENLGSLQNQIYGTLSLDLDKNGCDTNDYPIPFTKVNNSIANNKLVTFTDADGNYQINVGKGNHITKLANSLSDLYSSKPLQHTSNFTDYYNSKQADFCVTPEKDVNDLVVQLYPLTDASPGFEAKYLIVFHNTGTTIMDGSIQFSYDGSKLDFVSSNEPINQQMPNVLDFGFINLIPFHTRTIEINLKLKAPPTNEISDSLLFETIINPTNNDYTIENNKTSLQQEIIGSYDPNDIAVLEGKKLLYEDISNYLHYIIRFQNTGTASAINIRVENDLDQNLDWSTMELENMSHDGKVTIKNGNKIEFLFDNIHLPNSTSNELKSHGYIAYKIKPKKGINVGEIIFNEADIYFDYNLPIKTNTVDTEIYESSLSITENSIKGLNIYPNPTNSILNIQSKSEILEIEVYDTLGRLLLSKSKESGIKSINISKLEYGVYFLKLKNRKGNYGTKKIWKY